jgi:hypothetical protein
MNPRTSTTGSARRRAAVGVVAATLTVGAVGGAYALATGDRPAAEVVAGDATPETPVVDQFLRTPDPMEAEVRAAAEEYTQERSDAFWGAGYWMEDANALADLWHVNVLEAKGRAGQLLLDGQPVPIAPGSSVDMTDPDVIAGLELNAYWDAGYNSEEGAELAALWNVDIGEAKQIAGRMLRDGQALPIAPHGTPAP